LGRGRPLVARLSHSAYGSFLGFSCHTGLIGKVGKGSRAPSRRGDRDRLRRVDLTRSPSALVRSETPRRARDPLNNLDSHEPRPV
jgi:hypothetical protein